MIWLTRHGWPVTFFKRRPVVNLLRWFLHASVVASVLNRPGWYRSDGGLRCPWLDAGVEGCDQAPSSEYAGER